MTTDAYPVAADAHGIVNISGGLKMAHGQVTPTAGVHAVATGLTKVLSAVANLEGSPSAAAGEPFMANAFVGDQAGTPAAGSIQIKSWQDDATAATSGFEIVNWVAIGW